VTEIERSIDVDAVEVGQVKERDVGARFKVAKAWVSGTKIIVARALTRGVAPPLDFALSR
jgi:hypothetical protein